MLQRHYAQNPLDTFPRSFPVDGGVQLVAVLLRGNWCNGFLPSVLKHKTKKPSTVSKGKGKR